MTESKFSANFSLFNMDGLKVQFTVREDDQAKHFQLLQSQLDQLSRSGWRVTEPTGNTKQKLLHVVGWVLGEAEDKRAATFKPCVHLYAEYGEFKQATVYAEKLDELPIKIGAAKKWDGAAPDKASAAKRGVMNHCDFDVMLDPILAPDGNPKMNDKGFVQYKYGNVKGAAPAASAANDSTDFTLADVEEQDPDLWKPNTYSKKPTAAAKPQAFVWPVSEEMLSIAAGVIQMHELQGEGARLLTYVTGLHHNSKGKMSVIGTNKVTAKETGGQYGFIVGLLDKRYGSSSHGMILSALCGEEITSANPPGFQVKELIDWLVAPEENKVKLAALDQVVAFVKEVVAEVEEA
jgi:hypothetical protein